MKWAYSNNEEEFHGSYDTKDEAVLDGFLNDADADSVWVGHYDEWDKALVIREVGSFDGQRVMEDIIERFMEDAPEWACEEWGAKLLTKENCDKVNNFLANFIMETEPPTWFEMSGVPELVNKVDWEKDET